MVSKERLYRMMRLRTMTVSELSRQADVSRTYINKLLKGTNGEPNLKCLKRVAKALKCTPAWLLEEGGLNGRT